MRLYTRTGASALTTEHGQFEADEDGGFNFPDEVSDQLHRFHVKGKPAWETDIERQHRRASEELERRRDPATLQALVEQLTLQAAANQAATAEAPSTAKRATKRVTSKPSE